MFTHFRPAAKKQPPKPPQNKNSVYIKYGYFMGNPVELAAQQNAAVTTMPLPEPEQAVISVTEHNRADIPPVCCAKVIAKQKGRKNTFGIKKKPYILYRKSKGTRAATALLMPGNNSVNTYAPVYGKPHSLPVLVGTPGICCRGGPVIS